MKTISVQKYIRVLKKKWRADLYKLLFLDVSINGKMFNTALMSLILLSVIVVMLQSVYQINQQYGTYMLSIEMFVTFIFTIEYIARIFCHPQPLKYVLSLQGLFDLLAVLPAYFIWSTSGSNYFLLFRVVRILHIFHIFELSHYTGEAKVLGEALGQSRAKIVVFIVFVASLVILVGFLMYIVEGQDNIGFSSIPKSIYWAVVTLTTVGYGDITPTTGLGRALAAVVMLLGYGVIAVPTGIVSAEIAAHNEKEAGKNKKKEQERSCIVCASKGHEPNALFCKQCGNRLHD
jgi:voltage-gated potassium channel